MIFISSAKQEFPLGNSEGDKEVEELSPYDEGTDEGPSASKASNSAHLRGRVIMTLAVTLVWKF